MLLHQVCSEVWCRVCYNSATSYFIWYIWEPIPQPEKNLGYTSDKNSEGLGVVGDVLISSVWLWKRKIVRLNTWQLIPCQRTGFWGGLVTYDRKSIGFWLNYNITNTKNRHHILPKFLRKKYPNNTAKSRIVAMIFLHESADCSWSMTKDFWSMRK